MDPKVGMIFNSKNEIIEYHKNYVECMCFGLLKFVWKMEIVRKKNILLVHLSNSKKYFEVNPITKTQDKTRLNVCVFV